MCILAGTDGKSDKSSLKVRDPNSHRNAIVNSNTVCHTEELLRNLKPDVFVSVDSASGLGESSCRLFGYMGLDSSADPQTDSFKLSFEEQEDKRVRAIKVQA